MKNKKRSLMFWFVVIILVAFVLGLFTGIAKGSEQEITGWYFTESVSEMDDEISYYLMKLSEGSIENLDLRQYWRLFVLAFDEDYKVDVVGIINDNLVKDGGVRYRFDDDEAVKSNWVVHDRHVIKFAKQEWYVDFIEKCKKSDVLKIEYDTYSDGTVVETFDLKGFAEKVSEVGW